MIAVTKPVFLAIICGLHILFAALGILIYRRTCRWCSLDRFIASLSPIAVLFGGLNFYEVLLAAPYNAWNGARLAQSFALRYGYRLYYGAKDGPVLHTIYGPVGPLAYYPATFASSPTGALLTAECLTFFYFFAPLVLALDTGRNGTRGAVATFSGCACLCLLMLQSPSLLYSATNVHVDAPALGLLACSCMVLLVRPRLPTLPTLLGSALLAVLAVWTKLSMAPAPLALSLYVLVAHGRDTFRRYVLCLVGCALAASAAFFWIFGLTETWRNTVAIPLGLGWRSGGKLLQLAGAGKELLSMVLVPAVAVLTYGIQSCRVDGFRARCRDGEYFRENPWILFLLVSLVLAPACVRHQVIFSGGVNAFSPTIYFLLLSAALIFARLCGPAVEHSPQGAQRISKTLAVIMLLAFSILSLIPVHRIYAALEGLPGNPEERMYRFLRTNPGKIYFPDNPLPALMAEGKLYHFSYGLFGRELTGRPLSHEEFRAHIPAEPQAFVLSPEETIIDEGYPHPVPKYLPDFVERSVDPDGYITYKSPG